jgi:DivIVA domain-containing protein
VTFPLADSKTLGYDQAQVDAFLDRARDAFQGNDTSLTSADLRAAAFPLVKGGYATAEVDAAVDRLEDTFAERERDARINEIGIDVWNAEARELAQEILNRIGRAKGRRFRRANLFTYGYNVVEVDAFANRIHDFFTAGEHLSRSEVRAIVFRPQLGGYDESQVDFLLDELVRVMLAVR